VQIECPSTCAYLSTAREHPAAVLIRQQQRDIALVVQAMRDLDERQSRLFFLIATFLIRYESPELQAIVDDDVGEAAGALAGTFETAARGIIYEHQPASLPAARLAVALKTVLTEAGKHATSAFDRDAAVVLRRIETAVHDARESSQTNGSSGSPSSGRGLIDLLARVVGPSADGAGAPPPQPEPPRLIVP
jgi:hypothetical protein